MNRVAATVGAVLAAAGLLPAQTRWSLQGGDARVRLAGPTTHWLQGPSDRVEGPPAGDYEVHFGVDAAGKPRSLAVAVGDGMEVRLATAAAPPVVADAAGGGEPATDYRVVAITPPGGDGVLGLVARQADGSHAVRFVWDRGAGEFRLERVFGGETRMLRRADGPRGDDALHTMALQVEGFRVDAFWDEANVLRALDGATTAGGFGAFTQGTVAAFAHVERQPVAEPRASAALVVGRDGAVLHAAVTVLPGHWHVLELRLDRAHPPLPTTEAGLEPWLLRGPAAPVVRTADWRGSFGPGGIGEVGTEGVFRSELRWPDLAALRHQCGLLRAVLVSPRGEVVVDHTPVLPFCIP